MTPWLVILSFVALANLFAFVAVRGRWDWLVVVLGVAAVAGAAGGDALGARLRVEPIRLGDFHVVSASVGAQVAMLTVTLVAWLLPGRWSAPRPWRR